MKQAFCAAFLLAGCGGAGPAAPDNRIECRPAGAASFARTCTIETAESPDGLVLTLRKADGGFRRLLLAGDERGLVAADGAEPADIALLPDGRIEVGLGGDRFRLPPTAETR